VEPNFGEWLKKVRARAGLSQKEMASLLGLESYAAVYLIEQKPERRLQPSTLEALLDLLGLTWEEELDEMWLHWRLPDRGSVRARVTAMLSREGPLAVIAAIAREAGLSSEEVSNYLLRAARRDAKEFDLAGHQMATTQLKDNAPGIHAEGESKRTIKLAAHKPRMGKGTGAKKSEPPPDPVKPLK
jgi:DNA-binding XRE family transcriptional regulator